MLWGRLPPVGPIELAAPRAEERGGLRPPQVHGDDRPVDVAPVGALEDPRDLRLDALGFVRDAELCLERTEKRRGVAAALAALGESVDRGFALRVVYLHVRLIRTWVRRRDGACVGSRK